MKTLPDQEDSGASRRCAVDAAEVAKWRGRISESWSHLPALFGGAGCGALVMTDQWRLGAAMFAVLLIGAVAMIALAHIGHRAALRLAAEPR